MDKKLGTIKESLVSVKNKVTELPADVKKFLTENKRVAASFIAAQIMLIPMPNGNGGFFYVPIPVPTPSSEAAPVPASPLEEAIVIGVCTGCIIAALAMTVWALGVKEKIEDMLDNRRYNKSKQSKKRSITDKLFRRKQNDNEK